MMKKWTKKPIVLLLAAAQLSSCFGALAQDARVAPAESFYGYANQETFASFDSGIEGAWVEPVFGELVCPDPQTDYEYSGDQQMQRAQDEAAAEVKERLFSGKLFTAPGSPGQRILDLYDSLKHADEDREKDDARFLEMAKPILEAQNVESFVRAASAL